MRRRYTVVKVVTAGVVIGTMAQMSLRHLRQAREEPGSSPAAWGGFNHLAPATFLALPELNTAQSSARPGTKRISS